MSKPKGIAWLKWGRAAFNKAKEEDKPILLAITAKWCHWCHVMDSTSYSDPEVIELIKENYVPIRVDNDRRPDINSRYNMGGWPTTAILTPDGDVLTGETYVPPENMRALLKGVHQLYKDRKEDIYSQVEKVKAGLNEKKPREGDLDESIVDEGLLFAIEAFEPRYGGFGREPKFPQASMLTLCLRQHYLSNRRVLKKIVIKTLDGMGEGGMYDHVEGGFFRYSTTRDWSTPHYEKMLEDNANLARLYLEAYHVFKEEHYREKALDVLRYLSKNLADEEGGFYGSQDAGEDYYKLGMEERKKSRAPFIDKTVFTGWNGLAVSAYLYAYALTGGKDYLRTSMKAVQRLLRKAVLEGGGLLHHLGEQSLTGVLEDQVYFSQALVDAYQATGEYKYLGNALELVGFMMSELWSEKGGFYDIAQPPEALGLLEHRQKPFPSNSDAASLLLDISLLTGEQVYREYAEKTLKFFASGYPNYGVMGGNYFLAVSKYFAQPLQLSIVGSIEDQSTQKLLKGSLMLYHPFKLVQLLDPGKDGDLMHKKGLSVPESPTLYPCVGARCLMPITDDRRIAESLG